MNNQKGFTTVELAMFMIWIGVIVGWLMNISDIIHAIHDPIDALLVIRIIGIFVFPLGAAMGYLT